MNTIYFSVQIGVCGEHASDPHSIRFFERLNVDYVTCSPYRIPIAKVAAAQAHIHETIRKLPSCYVCMLLIVIV